ncbi:uncharacterized protein G2W53_006820 [Senna tora]|uniref:Uncharacterized protein n=1 Tax=Senna tora TaxID=362788 RepID=A0A834X519_9FABA|nr:uncharacterized protein G2W53_006820 [Senna tora]
MAWREMQEKGRDKRGKRNRKWSLSRTPGLSARKGILHVTWERRAECLF